MATVIGIVGYQPGVGHVADACASEPDVHVRVYDDHDGAFLVPKVEAHQADVDGWLLPNPFLRDQLHRHLGELPRPVASVEVSGATLLSALVGLLQRGRDVSKLSIDTITRAEVMSSLKRAGIPTTHVKIRPYRPGPSSDDVVEFHRRHRRRHRDAIAITCLDSAHKALSAEMEVVKLEASEADVRDSLHELMRLVDTHTHQDAQIALAVVDYSGPANALARQVVRMGATLARTEQDEYLVIATRGSLSAATGGFVKLHMLRHLADHSDVVRVGIGLGQVAPEAEDLARRALTRARKLGPIAAVLNLRSGVEIVLGYGDDAPSVGEPTTDFKLLSQRIGLSVDTLQRLRTALTTFGSQTPFTARQLADHLQIQPHRTRRILQRLENTGLAHRVGNKHHDSSGRPQTLYQVDSF